jgi:hypothetical protein
MKLLEWLKEAAALIVMIGLWAELWIIAVMFGG